MKPSIQNLLAAALVGSMVFTTTGTLAQITPKTEIPPGIAVPDQVETRLGTLKFFDGFPDDPSVQKLYDNLDFQHAVRSYCWPSPYLSRLSRNLLGRLRVRNVCES